MTKTKKILIAGGLFCFIVLTGMFFSFPVFAYQIEKHDDRIEDRFIVTPPKFDFQIESGQSLETDFTVVNRLGRDEEFKIVVEELTDFGNSKKSFSATSWVEPEINSFSLSQGERITQKLKITAPDNIPSGGYYAVIAVLVEGEGEGASGKIKLISQAGISLLTTVPGNLREDLSISRLSSDKFFYLNGPVDFKAIFKNDGDVHVSSQGHLEVRNFLGSKVAEIPINSTTVLPVLEKNWQATWNKKWLMGKYDYKMTLFYGQNKQKITKDGSFFAFPVHILLLVIVIIFILYYLLRKIPIKVEIKKSK
jgi:hypothetical protein